MFLDSVFASSAENPIRLEEHSEDVKTLLIIIAGRPCQAETRFEDWDTSKRLYLLMQKYRLDRLQPWFSIFAGDWAGDAPFEALCLACNNPCFDENLARNAVLYGIEEKNTASLFDPEYFKLDYASYDGDDDHRKLRLLNPCNTKVKFSLDLGLKGFTAYCQAFSDLESEKVDWQLVAWRFNHVVREVEKERGTSVRTTFE
jgi:hypothetical protein